MRRSTQVALGSVMALLGAGIARAEPDAAPLPGDELRGTDMHDAPDSAGRRLAQGILFIPQKLVELVLLPVRGAVWLWDRYDLEALYYRTFYNASGTFGIVPTVNYQTGFGLTVGAQVLSTNLYGHDEHMSLVFGYGGAFRSLVIAHIDSGRRLAPFGVALDFDYKRRPQEPFYGIGNNDVGERAAMLVDPTSDTAHETFFRYRELRGGPTVGVQLLEGLRVQASGAAIGLEYGRPTSNTAVTDVFRPGELPGFVTPVEQLYGELEVRLDRRVVTVDPHEAKLRCAGYYASGFIGRVVGLQGAHDFSHYGFDLQKLFRLGLGPRTLALRFAAEGVTGSLAEVPITELPYLGGDYLRGYPYARFRDRIAAFASVQYGWDLGESLAAFVFTDFGRVYRSVDDITLDDLRVGFGGGVQWYSGSSFLVGASIGTSIDGGVVVTASFSPVLDGRPAWR